MRSIVEKLFSKATTATIAATVKRRIRAGRYELADDAGRIIQADSSQSWSPGSRVLVQAGRIIGVAGQIRAINIYEV